MPDEHWLPNHFVPVVPFETCLVNCSKSDLGNGCSAKVCSDNIPRNASRNVQIDENNNDTHFNNQNKKYEGDTGLDEILIEFDNLSDYIGKYVVVQYDGMPYPGYVEEADQSDVYVVCMHHIGKKNENRFFWPNPKQDKCWYDCQDIIALIPEPTRICSNHFQIENKAWEKSTKICFDS
jgi:hypothetical protein